MNIDIEFLDKIKLEADRIFLEPEGEETLVKLLEIQTQVEQAIDAAKVKLADAALKLNPNFSSIQGDKVKVYYRAYGSRYKIDESLIDQIPIELYTKKLVYTPVAEAIEEWTKQHEGMPIGIIEPERSKSLSFSLKEKVGDNNGKTEAS